MLKKVAIFKALDVEIKKQRGPVAVKDGYKGFDVRESHEWSKLWLSKIKEPASGSAMCWREQLKQAGL